MTETSQIVAEILQALQGANRVLICGHVRADGDCIGSMAALFAYLRASGKQARLFFRGPVQEAYLPYLPEGQSADGDFPADYEPDATLCLDASSADRIVADFPAWAQGTIVNIDHHGDNTRYGALNWVDARYAAVGEMVCELLEAASDCDWTPAMAEALYMAIATDTGGFRYGNTTARALAAAARLVERGAAPARVAQAAWGNRSVETLRILASVLGGARFALGGRLAWAELRQDVLARNGGEASEPDNLSGELRAIRGVEVALLLRETPEGTVRASLRSAGVVDVAAIAARLGGGGHRAAAGVELDAPYAEGLERILEAVERGVREQLGGLQDSDKTV